jgi:Ni/Co efflux regulator RcnB
MLAAGSAFAEKPSWAGKDHGHGAAGNSQDHRDDGREAKPPAGAVQFGPNERMAVRDYYAGPIAAGKCPPGLAKKNNGCLPPGQAKKWAIGQRLPTGVIYYDLPRELALRLPAPPAGHRYVRLASDILMIATGTSIVLDAIQDLGRL